MRLHRPLSPLPLLFAFYLIFCVSSTPMSDSTTISDIHLAQHSSSSSVPPSVKSSAKAKAVNYFAAAACCARGPRCWPRHARNSLLCRQGLWMSAQSKECQQAACHFCMRKTRKNNWRRSSHPVCRAIAILKNCFKSVPPYPSPPKHFQPPPPSPPKPNKPTSSSSPSSPNRPCTFRGHNGKVVVPAYAMPARGHWSRTHGASTITYKVKGGAGIDKPQKGNPFCIRFKPDVSGLHYFTVVSSAPHPTEHNDAWFKFPRKPGFTRFRPQGGSVLGPKNDWLKGYQNEGKNKRANYVLNVDFNGHQFITPELRKGKSYSFCISGRSTKYTIYKAVLVACPSIRGCSRYSRHIKRAMKYLPASKCY